MVSGICTSWMQNNECQIVMVEILLLKYVGEKERNKDDSEAVDIMKLVKSTEILLFINSLNYLRENLKQMLSHETTCICLLT